MIKLLIVDDSALMRRLIGGVFKANAGFEIAFARDGVEALIQLHNFHPHVVTLDVHMPQMDGLTCLGRIMVERPCPVIMVSSLTEAGADATLEAMNLGAVDFVAKPEGAVSLAMDEFAPILLEKVRAASTARLSPALRLTERVKLKLRTDRPAPPTRQSPVLTTSPLADVAPPLGDVVVVGCSTGGPPALDALLSSLPANFPWPVVIAQHMPASFTAPLSRRLDKLCALTVSEVTRPVALAPGQVYVGKGDADIIVTLRSDKVVVAPVPSSPEHRWHPSVDRLVSTALHHLGGKRLIGVMMTGMGDDGAAAMTRLRREGGRTIAEAEETAVVWGMPGELVRMGGAEVVAPLGSIAQHLVDWAS